MSLESTPSSSLSGRRDDMCLFALVKGRLQKKSQQQFPDVLGPLLLTQPSCSSAQNVCPLVHLGLCECHYPQVTRIFPAFFPSHFPISTCTLPERDLPPLYFWTICSRLWGRLTAFCFWAGVCIALNLFPFWDNKLLEIQEHHCFTFFFAEAELSDFFLYILNECLLNNMGNVKNDTRAPPSPGSFIW